MIEHCFTCNGMVKIVKDKVLLNLPNRSILVLEAEHGKCEKCGEAFFDGRQSALFAKKADEALTKMKKRELKTIEVPSGSVIV